MIPRRVGLLGGSFNPAHAGHLHVSREAIRRLGLDQVWWLVTPQNPLKSAEETRPYAERLAEARALAAPERRIVVSDVEAQARPAYTYATLSRLKRRYPGTQFVWLMGADNLAGFHRWRRWRDIARLVPFAVFDRAPFSHTALHGRAALALKRLRRTGGAVRTLARQPGRWAYVLMRRHPASATELRKKT